jgi:hypothetical protein
MGGYVCMYDDWFTSFYLICLKNVGQDSVSGMVFVTFYIYIKAGTFLDFGIQIVT